VTQARLRGYRRALEDGEIAFDQELVEDGRWDAAEAGAATQRVLERRGRLTAIFVQNDTMAIGVLSALRGLGKRVPEDCAVMGCDDIVLAEYAAPPLTTVHLPYYEAGAEGMRLLLNMIAADTSAPQKVLLPVRVIARAST
jgi:DNA-binding LacI/PurR family transcriptional regulator